MLKKLFGSGKASSAPEKVATVDNQHGQAGPAAAPVKAHEGRKRSPRGRARADGQAVAEVAWSLDQFPVPAEEGKVRFHDLDLDLRLMRGIADTGFKYCSPIQGVSLPHTLRGNDVIGKAQTGTGKTAAFLITIFNDLLSNPIDEERFAGEPRALVIAPTRELVVQIGEDARALGKYAGLNVVTLIGGMDYQKQQDKLAGMVDIVVATPGRLLDFEGRKDLYLDQIEILVIDEADRMLDMGFIPQVKRIVRATPSTNHRQTLLFSATFTDDIMRLTEQWTKEPVKIEIEPESVATDTVDQKVYLVESQDKFRLLLNIVKEENAKSVIIFANRRDETRRLFEKMQKAGIRCGILSGEIPQNKRSRTLQQFKDGEIECLVATDVAGRGIHVDGVSHVVNYVLPEDAEDYVHRIGRTGRAGATGTSISFACEDDAFLLPNIEEALGMKLPCTRPPEHLLR
ncbi:ATP-dependent RNA helicase RhlB [Zhongshania guokunii]|uniref:ATP-dependent RNA helicase RhlB n=1 Tax=Zhongshania guokunii TaxID=641783 RepID=A0ABV3U3W7_9GAMM